MKWFLLALVPVAFIAGIVVGRRSVSQPVADATPPPAAKPASLPVVEPLKPPPAQIEAETANESGNDEADRLAQQGLEAYVKGQYALSIELCNRALRANNRQPLALRILGAVNCKLRNREGALKAYNQAEPQFRNFIRMVCHSEGVELP